MASKPRSIPQNSNKQTNKQGGVSPFTFKSYPKAKEELWNFCKKIEEPSPRMEEQAQENEKNLAMYQQQP
jgi:hypothetical protein